jgi:7-cyano-7-deazaguanine synthase
VAKQKILYLTYNNLEHLLNNKVMKKAVLSLSGGMDSSSLLLHLLANDYEVTALGFDYGQKHKVELERAQSLVEYLNTQNCGCGGRPVYGNVVFQVIELYGLSKLLNSSLVTGGQDVPEGHYEQDNMKETVVPNRNKIFSSIIQAVALSEATKGEKQEVAIAMGIHAGDHAIYPDCRQEFRDVDFDAFKAGNWDADLVYHYTPYLEVNKFDILKDGQDSITKLKLDFNEVYKRTNTSYKPINIPKEIVADINGVQQTITSSVWYSDYKSASSVERIEAFIKLGVADPVAYADENGPVTWEVAKAHVEAILAEHNS